MGSGAVSVGTLPQLQLLQLMHGLGKPVLHPSLACPSHHPPRAVRPALAGASGNPPDVVTLADEIVAHLRGLVGGDAMLAGYNAAREAVRRQRGERKKKAALQVCGDSPGYWCENAIVSGCEEHGVFVLGEGR